MSASVLILVILALSLIGYWLGRSRALAQEQSTRTGRLQALPQYYGYFEDNDPTGRMMALVNYNADLAEYWEWSGRGFFPVDPTTEAYKLGVNYIIYAMSH